MIQLMQHHNNQGKEMKDHNTEQRQEWLADIQGHNEPDPDNSPWWWAIGIALAFTLVMLVAGLPRYA